MSQPVSFKIGITRKLSDTNLQTLKRRLEEGKYRSVRVGLPDTDHINRDGNPTGFTNAEVGFMFEFGSPEQGIPEQPFLRTTLLANGRKYVEQMRIGAIQIVSGKTTVKGMLSDMGALIRADTRATLKRGEFRRLKPNTIKSEGSSKPLIDTKQMQKSITWELRND